jgi:hypothetical protein
MKTTKVTFVSDRYSVPMIEGTTETIDIPTVGDIIKIPEPQEFRDAVIAGQWAVEAINRTYTRDGDCEIAVRLNWKLTSGVPSKKYLEERQKAQELLTKIKRIELEKQWFPIRF